MHGSVKLILDIYGTYGFLCVSENLHGFLCFFFLMDSIDFCGFLWVSGEFLQISVEFNGFLENFYVF